jgi:hypothetical protein
MKARTLYVLVGLFLGEIVFGRIAGANDGTNGASGPALLDYNTDQLFDSQDPPHYLVVGTDTYTQTGHGTLTLDSVLIGSGSANYLPKWTAFARQLGAV